MPNIIFNILLLEVADLSDYIGGQLQSSNVQQNK